MALGYSLSPLQGSGGRADRKKAFRGVVFSE